MKCKEKTKYFSKKEVETIRNFKMKHKRDTKMLAIYLCRNCNFWHLTSHFGKDMALFFGKNKKHFVRKK